MRVLVVEDDEGIAEGLKATLRQHGEAVDVAASVAAAAAVAARANLMRDIEVSFLCG